MRVSIFGSTGQVGQHLVERALDRDWVIVRPPRLSNASCSGDWQSGYLTLGPMASMARADLAEFMLQQVASEEWVREFPMVTN